MKIKSGEAMELDLFPTSYGGSIPTSPLQFKIIPIDKRISATIYRKFHYFGDKDFLSSYNYGAVFDGDVWGAITFGIPNAKNINGLYSSDTQHGVLEIVRLAFHPLAPKNSPSRMIRIATMLLNPARRRYRQTGV